MLTVIHEDGTCSREYTFHTTQQWLGVSPDDDYDSLVTKNWECSISVLGADSVRYPAPLTQAKLDSLQELDHSKPLGNYLMAHAKKEYQSVEEMSAHLYRAERHHLQEVENIKANSTLEKHFKWFYTDYTFSETFVYDGPALFPIPLDRFLSADTASFWFTGQPDLTCHCSGAEQKDMLDDIEKKIGQWTNANWFYEICNVIIANYDQIQNPPVSKERFSIVRDSLVMMPCVLNANEGEGLGDNITNLLEKTFQSDAYKLFLQTNESGFKQYEQLLSFGNNYDLQMPGTVIDAGMGQYDGDVIHYRLGGERLIPGAYTITATSRVTNVWAFVITILVVLLAIGSLFFRKNMKCFGK